MKPTMHNVRRRAFRSEDRPDAHEFTVVALVRPWEIPWEDASAIGSALTVDWVRAESVDDARSAFLIVFARRTGLTLEDVAIVAIFAGHLAEGDAVRRSVRVGRHAGSLYGPTDAEGAAKADSGSGPALLSVKQFLDGHACLTMGWLRAALFNRQTNGLAAAVVQCGRKILIDEVRFFEWLEAQQGHGATRDPRRGRA